MSVNEVDTSNEETAPEQSTEQTDDSLLSRPKLVNEVDRSEHPLKKGKEKKEKIDPPQSPANKTGKPNRIFDAVALGSFGIKDTQSINGQGGRIAKISNWLLKCEPIPTPERLTEFYDWYGREYSGVNAPRDLDKFIEHWQRFGQNDTPRRIGPRVTKLIDTEAA
jgi:hypothetical protein